MANDFSSFFGNPSALPNTTPTSFSPGYFLNNMELISQGMAKQQTSAQNTLLNYTTIQSDKNFNLTTIQNELTSLTAILGVSTQMFKSAYSQTKVLGVTEYNPINFQNSLFNQQSLVGSSTNFLPSVQQGQTSKSISSGFGSDLKTLFGSGTLNLAMLAQISSIISTIFAISKSISNTAITNVLPTSIGSYVNNSMTSITTSNQYQDSMNDSGLDQSTIDSVTANINDFLNTQSSQPISSMVTTSNYQNIAITLSDPIGINIASTLNNEISNTFSSNLTNFILQQNIPNASDIIDIINNDFQNNVNSSISNALPNMSAVCNGVITESSNILSTDMNAEFDSVVVSILNSFGAIVPIGNTQTPFDALFNLHRNIQIRNSLLQTGGTIEQISNLDAAVSEYFVAGTFNQTTLSQLEQQLESFVGA